MIITWIAVLILESGFVFPCEKKAIIKMKMKLSWSSDTQKKILVHLSTIVPKGHLRSVRAFQEYKSLDIFSLKILLQHSQGYSIYVDLWLLSNFL